tara:strand:- start:38 stop:217 length:180 start_codon:yes stop_codon:yes gene_type:complete
VPSLIKTAKSGVGLLVFFSRFPPAPFSSLEQIVFFLDYFPLPSIFFFLQATSWILLILR